MFCGLGEIIVVREKRSKETEVYLSTMATPGYVEADLTAQGLLQEKTGERLISIMKVLSLHYSQCRAPEAQSLQPGRQDQVPKDLFIQS